VREPTKGNFLPGFGPKTADQLRPKENSYTGEERIKRFFTSGKKKFDFSEDRMGIGFENKADFHSFSEIITLEPDQPYGPVLITLDPSHGGRIYYARESKGVQELVCLKAGYSSEQIKQIWKNGQEPIDEDKIPF
jgi:hypothetical protein